MALRLRLRGALSLSSSLLHHHPLHQPQPISSHLLSTPTSHTPAPSPTKLARPFTSTTTLFRKTFDPQTDEIAPDTILFEGCDYNHWLITVDFPRDANISREQMIETYVDTAAQVFGSVEEAKKKIYALSTTTYQGFQVECSEETSEKFTNLPGVVFVLPDSYIDPVNKEYGGDKYVNGEIFPRPPPVHYGRRTNRRPYQQNNYGPPPQQNHGPPPQQNHGHPPQQNHGHPPQQNHGHPPQQNHGPPPQQNYRPPRQDGPPSRQDFRPPPRQDYGPQPRQDYWPPPQQDYRSPPQQNYPQRPHQSYGPPPQQSDVPPPQRSYGNTSNSPSQQSYNPPGSGERRGSVPPTDDSRHGERNAMPSYQGNFNQAEYGNHYAQGQIDFPQGNQQSHMSPGQRGFPQDSSYGSSQVGSFEQGSRGLRNFSSTGNN